jgi:hypothetical protein
MPRRDSNTHTYAIDRAATGTWQMSYTICKLMDLDPSVSKNSILDVFRPTTTYITKKKKTNEFVIRTCQENVYTVVSMAAIIILMLYL